MKSVELDYSQVAVVRHIAFYCKGYGNIFYVLVESNTGFMMV